MDQSSSEQPAPKKKKKKRASSAEPTEASARREAPPPPTEHWFTAAMKRAGVKILALLVAIVIFAMVKSCQEKRVGERDRSLDAPVRGAPAALALS